MIEAKKKNAEHSNVCKKKKVIESGTAEQSNKQIKNLICSYMSYMVQIYILPISRGRTEEGADNQLRINRSLHLKKNAEHSNVCRKKEIH